jgi:hypothetical protein
MSGLVRPDLNNPEFQRQLFSLQSDQTLAVISALKKISQLTWEQVYKDKGLRWEAIESRTRKNGTRLYSFRITQKFRALAHREGEWMRCVSLHPDHDSAYEN